MKKLIYFALTAVAFSACNNPSQQKVETTESISSVDTTTSSTTAVDTVHTSQNSLDWAGTYEATIPCADCPGIKTSLQLNNDGTFVLQSEYLERKNKFEEKGNFAWINHGSTIQLQGKENKTQYKVGENKLIQLDMEGKEITGEHADLYTLHKK
ncbi:copper resistance protein NlpE [Sphingobacterium psychroaquaticum]|uniref:Uncharacterized lipoprotein NlpE involved in copper resistance n=1 Tax=Sphingobacterium psychroaquaticum TaxID=561061 RepID=A0A1X7KYC6_9SPHI|nr:copper resistance protein NlpE [Sphingobacterium psychroaquaticum]SMG46224.1 Uncharacterized lipoprotein NlpE involved in copper resistance [Sphingobacterium psychroaquaticum]